MPSFTGHPLVDVGLATITAFAGKTRREDLTKKDYDAIVGYVHWKGKKLENSGGGFKTAVGKHNGA